MSIALPSMDLPQRALPRHAHHQHQHQHQHQPPSLSNPSPSHLPPQHSGSTYSPGPVASHPTLPLPGTHPPSSALTPGSASTSPASISHRLPSASASSTSRHPTGDYQDAEDPDASTTLDGDEPPKKKQKRNKPTLSCHECVERKTKVRYFYLTHCHAIVSCRLTHVAPYERWASPLFPVVQLY